MAEGQQAQESITASATERWTTASSGVNDAAKWLAAAIGSISGVVLGAGPIIRSDVDVTEWSPVRWVGVLVLAAIAAGAAGAVVWRLLQTLVPVAVTLDQLPSDLKSKIERNELGEYLPGDARTLADFKLRLQGYSRAAAQLRTKLQSLDKTDPRRPRFEALAQVQEANRDLYLAKRNEIYALAKYEIEANRLTNDENRNLLTVYLVIAATTLVAFTFLTSTGGSNEPDAADEGDVVAPTAALLQPSSGSQELWERLRLSECSIEGQDGPIPVFLLEEGEDNYRVQTLGTPPGCDRYVFDISKDLVEPISIEPITVTLEPPGPTASPEAPSKQ